MNNNDLVILELDRPRELRFGYRAMKTLVSLSGKSIEDIDKEGVALSDFEKIKMMVYCGLLIDAEKHGETLTVEDVEELFDKAPYFSYVYERMILAWHAAFGVTENSGNQPEPVEQPAKEENSTSKKASK